MDEFAFLDELNQAPINLPRAALRFAQEIAYPGMDIYTYLVRLDHLAHSARGFLDPEAPLATQADLVADFLFRQLGFSGNSSDYADPRNSYLNEVLDRRLGIPISLSTVFIAVARKLGIHASGIALPGHFIVGVPAPKKMYFYDPFHGGARISEEDCADLVRTTTGYTGPLQPEWLLPVPEGTILTRMLNNLRLIYIQTQEWDRARAVIDHIRLLQPDQPDLLRDLGFIFHQSGSLHKAAHYYEQYLLRQPPEEDAQAIARALQRVTLQLARLN
jgi:regulator of sirC expression with transglutaminase-like and TPR domain